ncbi:MAG: AAA family ATPase [Methanosarcina sp.]
MLNIKGLYLDNFRIFAEASSIRLAPITILTGPNNSGKSTLAGSVSMMKDLDTSSLPYRIRFDSGRNPYSSFGMIRNNRISSRRSTAGYDLYNIILGEDINVRFTFEKDNDFDAVVRNIRLSNAHGTLFDFKFEKERIVAQVNLDHMLGKLKAIRKSKERYLEIERNFKNIRSDSGSYKNEVSEKKLGNEETNIRIFHVDNELKRKNVLGFLKQQDMSTEEYERLFYFFGKHRNMPCKDSMEEDYIRRVRKLITDFDDKEILLNSKLFTKLASIPHEQLTEANLRYVLKTDFPELYDCLLLLNNPEQLSKITDLLKQKNYSEWEKEFVEDEITTSQRMTFSGSQKKLPDTIENHIHILFGESNLFNAISELASSREGFQQVFNDYKNLKALSSFCQIVVEKAIHDLKSDLDKSISIPVRYADQPEMSVSFGHPLYELVKKHSQARKKDGFMKDWLKRFNLCDDIFFEAPVKGMGYFPGIKKRRESSALSEEGAGSRRLIMMLLEIAGSSQKCDLHDYNDEPMNYPRTIMVEEPESRLHPAWQSKLADMFTEARKEFGYHFLIETCSEYLIRKLQYLVASGKIDKNDVVIYYLDGGRCKENNRQPRQILIGEDGSLSEEFGPGFLYENDVEMFKLKKVNKN